VWLRRGPPEASSNSNPTFFPILNIDPGGLLLVCITTGLDKDTFARYFLVRFGSWLLSSSVLEVYYSFPYADGFHAVLLVVVVPEIVSSKYISTALGAHKSVRCFNTAH
jgi:hypothetical protein